MRPTRRRVANYALALTVAVSAVVHGCVARAHASLLLAPSVGAPDLANNGSKIGRPTTPDSALFANPAGLVDFETTTVTGAFGILLPRASVDSDLVGYNRSDERVAFFPSGGVSIPLAPRWRFGAGLYGNVGTVFDFEAEPPEVPSDFVSDVSIAAAPLALAYEVSSRLWVGVELIPLFGYLRNRYALPDGMGGTLPIEYTLRGPGLQAMVGVSFRPTDGWTLGASVRTPGMVWMDGSTVLAGDRVDVDCEVQVPSVVWLGATRRLGERWDLSTSVRWTDSSTFGESKIEYGAISIPFVPDAKDEWRGALGLEYRWSERLTLRGGPSYATRVVGSKGVSPLLFDTDDWRLAVGASYDLEAWTLHAMAGHAFEGERSIAPDEALSLPGEYKSSGQIFMLGFTYRRS
jgi:long-subunit fatty acid transport protein